MAISRVASSSSSAKHNEPIAGLDIDFDMEMECSDRDNGRLAWHSEGAESANTVAIRSVGIVLRMQLVKVLDTCTVLLELARAGAAHIR